MVTVDSDDGAEYDDDFEDASEDETRKSFSAGFAVREALESQKPTDSASGGLVPAQPLQSRAPPSRGRRPGRRHQEAPSQELPPPLVAAPRSQEQPVPALAKPPTASPPPSAQLAPVDSLADSAIGATVPLSSAPPSGGRPVRGRVSVATEESDPGRPGTGGSGGGNGNKAGRPMWLQFESGMPQRQVGSRDSAKPTSSPSLSGRARPPRSADLDLEDRVWTAGTDGGDRKAKRLQQEIQKLTQRLKEAELFSAEDDGLPTFKPEEVEVGSQIAQGGFASVHHATWRCTPCAMKKIFDPVITAELKADFENEVRMLRRLRHPNIVTLMAVCRTPPSLSFLTEYVDGGSLFEMLHGQSQSGGAGVERSSSTLPHILQQAASALAYMHATDIVHRDVKSHNVLLCGYGPRPHTKLCDFGLARMKSELCSGTMQWAGTAPYMALELFEKRRYTEAVDVFAYGVLVWEAAAGDIPHANLEATEILERVRHKECAGLGVARSWPAPLKALLRAALSAKQEERPCMAEVANQLQGFRDFPNPLDGGG